MVIFCDLCCSYIKKDFVPLLDVILSLSTYCTVQSNTNTAVDNILNIKHWLHSVLLTLSFQASRVGIPLYIVHSTADCLSKLQTVYYQLEQPSLYVRCWHYKTRELNLKLNNLDPQGHNVFQAITKRYL